MSDRIRYGVCSCDNPCSCVEVDGEFFTSTRVALEAKLKLIDLMTPCEAFREESEPVSLYFGLSYASYYVVNRTLLEHMPVDWQRVFVACLTALDNACKNIDVPYYHVRALKRAQQLEQFDEPCPECDGEGQIDDWFDCPHCEGTGNDPESEGELRYETPEEVGFIEDPIPHYRRGHVELDLPNQ